MKTVMTIRPEVSIGCPWCASMFNTRRSFLEHVKACYERGLAGEEDRKFRFKFLKPQYNR